MLEVLAIQPNPTKAKAGAPDRIRTCDLCLRRAALYPAELRARAGLYSAPGILGAIGRSHGTPESAGVRIIGPGRRARS